MEASIIKGTNRVVCSTNVKKSDVKVGSLFKFQRGKTYYNVSLVDDIYLIKEFKSNGGPSIEISGNLEINLSVGDEILISYKEYELSAVWGITKGGSGYRVGDVLNLVGGTPSIDVNSGINQTASIKVKSVGPKGEIQEISLVSKGKYLELPPKIVSLSGAVGDGGTLDVEYDIINNRATIERVIKYIDVQSSVAYILLDNPLPVGVKLGKLSCEKIVIVLDRVYDEASESSSPFALSNDYTPNLGLSLLVPNSFSQEVLINKNFINIDNKIKELEDLIKKLTSANNASN